MLRVASLAAAGAHRKTATSLILTASPDLLCVNIMCQHVGSPCACRLTLALERMEQLTTLDISNNGFGAVPPGVFAVPTLESLDVSSNNLASLPEGVGRLSRLRCLILDRNPFSAPLPVPTLLALPHLRMVSVTGAEVLRADREALREGLWAKGGMLCE